MSSTGCSPSTLSALQDDSAANCGNSTRKPLRICFVVKRWEVDPNTEELVHTDAIENGLEDPGSNAHDGNSRTILNDEWPSWFIGRRGRKRKPSTPPDSIETPATSNRDVETLTTTTITKEKSIASPVATSSTLFMASAHNAAEQEAARDHVICNNNNKGKSIAANEEPKTHKCKSCPAAFKTGQQLGGHMRAHFNGTLRISASSKRAKGRGVAQAGTSSGTARDIAQAGSSSPQSVKDKDSNPLLFDLNETPFPEEEEQPNIHEGDQMLDLTLSLATRSLPN